MPQLLSPLKGNSLSSSSHHVLPEDAVSLRYTLVIGAIPLQDHTLHTDLQVLTFIPCTSRITVQTP